MKDFENPKVSGVNLRKVDKTASSSYEEMDILDRYMNETRNRILNSPAPVIAESGKDIYAEMPDLSPIQLSRVIMAANNENVRAMYVPYTKQIVLLPKHGTAKEINDAYFHESVHFSIDMILSKGDVDLPGLRARVLFPVVGCSMKPDINPGDVIGVETVENPDHIDPDKVYLIITTDQCMIKHLEPDEEDNEYYGEYLPTTKELKSTSRK